MIWIKLSKGYEAVVDNDTPYDILTHSWYASIRTNKTTKRKTVYAARNTRQDGKYKRLYLHRVIMKAPKDKEVDHISGNTLDCRRVNMRLTNRYGNMRNRRKELNTKGSKYIGVRAGCGKDSWTASICSGGFSHIGTFKSEIEAAMAYDRAAANKYKEFAKLNFPDGREFKA